MSISSILNKFFYIILILLFVLQLHNNLNFPVKRGFDAPAHIDYLRYLQKNNRAPLPTEGWEMYQPPLYYFIISKFPSLSLLWIFKMTLWLTIVATFYLYFRSISTTVLIISLPVFVYMSLPISNEFFSFVLITLSLVYYQSSLTTRHSRKYVILGVLLGLSLLAKSTSFILLFTIILNEVIGFYRSRKILFKNMTVLLFVTFSIAGWFYGRNIWLFHNPFAAPVNFPKLFPLLQPKITQGIYFFTNLSPFFSMDLFRAHYYSFLGGTYFSWFYDGHNIVIPPQTFSKAGILLILMSFPLIFLFVKGYISELKKQSFKNRVFLLYPLLLFGSYIIYNLKLPFYSTVKGAFLLSLVLPFGYFFQKGSLLYSRYKNIVGLYLIIYCLLVIKHFWIVNTWYR